MMAQPSTGEAKEEELNIVEIIEELPDEETDQFDEDALLSMTNSSDASPARPSAHEFSLSSIGFALAGTLTAHTQSLGSATEKLRQSFSQIQSSPRELSESARASNHNSRSSLPFGNSNKQPLRQVDFGKFESRAQRLQYTQEDVWNIATSPEQFDDLRQALRGLGAITNTFLKQNLHWYVKNSKRARREEEERVRREEEERARRLMEEKQRQEEKELEPTTPPTEYRTLDGEKVLQSVVATGVINPEDPSPTSVRGIFVPPS